MHGVATTGASRALDIEIQPVQPTIGAEVGAIDLRQPLSDPARDAIRAALVENKVLFFRDQHLSREQHIEFASRFGVLYSHPHANWSTPEPPGSPRGIGTYESRERDLNVGDGWDAFHTDTSWRLEPTAAAVLRAVTVPAAGGDTIWVDAARAYDTLPGEAKELLAGQHVTHDYRASLHAAGLDYPIVAHPLVRIQAETGRRVLWVNFTQHPWIVGADRARSVELLTIVHDQYRKPENQVRFAWPAGAVVLYDNLTTAHYSVHDYGDQPRLLERVLIADQPQYSHL